ncbi:glutamate racemase [Marinobacterium sediminicola]|uniref:Glutamate racemase n=1 Tax=Marinobacterium sediminicola TaxID=518898 RepID=A0ABY1S3Z2_9GAMM|nr:glutamate racemase [Marinobacterium sediminicola]ULG69907.1 glutamate racemase [Marinobacterium sediminicola]SMR77812.1 glutamate racemase [Marinobacterium sediminicola]
MGRSSPVDLEAAIGVFDSGVGGLTVLNALRKALPNENLVYLGDTARVPYGTKSAVSVMRYAEQAVKALHARRIKAIVIACNTASAMALEHLQNCYPELPVLGVIEPGALAACKATRRKHIGVIATESTTNNQAYQKAILGIMPEARIQAQACSLFVALAEEGWHHGELVEQIVAKCLKPLMRGSESEGALDTLVLGCTHFPALSGAIAKVVGSQVILVDSAATTASAVKARLVSEKLLNPQQAPGQLSFLVTDGPERFARVANNFFNEQIDAAGVELVDIQHHTATLK